MEKKKISRRCFLSKSGKLVGIGVLAHFTLIGQVNGEVGDESCPAGGCVIVLGEEACNGNFTCVLNEQTPDCTSVNPVDPDPDPCDWTDICVWSDWCLIFAKEP